MTEEPRVEFKVPNDDGSMDVVLKIDRRGMHYQGEFIPDAGKAHSAFIETMELMKSQASTVSLLTTGILAFLAGWLICYFGLSN